MVQRRYHARLALEPCTELFLADLNGDLAPKPVIHCQVDFTHSASSQKPQDPVRAEGFARFQDGLSCLRGADGTSSSGMVDESLARASLGEQGFHFPAKVGIAFTSSSQEAISSHRLLGQG